MLTVFIMICSAMLFHNDVTAQSSCCAKGKNSADVETSTKKASCSSATSDGTSGCSPSSCRGAQTKFGEAKVITDLRKSLISLKFDMENSTNPKFDKESFDIHGIVGETDDESLNILVDQIQALEVVFAEQLNHTSSLFELPENKAKQVQYLSARIDELNSLL